MLVSQLYEVYKDWCKANSEQEWSKRTFGTRLGERGFEGGSTPGGKARLWRGLALREPGAVTHVTQ